MTKLYYAVFSDVIQDFSLNLPNIQSDMWADSDSLGDEGGALMSETSMTRLSVTGTSESSKRKRASNVVATLNRIANTMEQMPKTMHLATEQLAKIAAWNRGWREEADCRWQVLDEVLQAPGLTISERVDVGEMLFVDQHKADYFLLLPDHLKDVYIKRLLSRCDHK